MELGSETGLHSVASFLICPFNSARSGGAVTPTQRNPIYSRRLASRLATPEGVWVYWRCNGRDDVSRVCDLSVGGLFIATPVARPPGVKAKLDFLVQEGQIRTEGVVCHQKPSGGLGLRFTAINEEDCPNLVALMTRVHSSPRSPGNS